MFRIQASALDNLLTGSSSDVAGLRREMRDALGQLFNLITGCGQLEHDTDGKQIDFTGTSPITAGVSGDHAILNVTQGNINAGTTSNPYLYSAIFNGPVKFSDPIKGAIRLATATGDWTNNAHPSVPTVAATDDETGDAVTIRLYRQNVSTDPNVRSGYTVPYMLTKSGVAVAVCGYADSKVGMIRLWSGSTTDITNILNGSGWYLCDGNNGTLNLVNRFIVCAGSTYAVGATGGATTHTHTGTTDGTALTTDGTGLTTNSGGTHTHTGSISSSGAHTHSGTTDSASITLSGLNTGYAATGITATDAGGTGSTSTATGFVTFTTAADTATGGVANRVSSITGDSHSHTGPSHTHGLTEPTNGGAGTGHRHSIPDLSHTHTFSISSSGSHTHSFTTDSDGSHTHTITSHTHTVASHTHTFTTGSGSSLPPYYALAYIQRVS